MTAMPVIAHSVDSWLPTTMAWLHHQVDGMGREAQIILAWTGENIDRFPWEPLYLRERPLDRLLQGTLRRIGYRWHPRVFHEAIGRHRPAVLHSHFGYMGWFDIPLAGRYGLKHVVSFYGADATKYPARSPVWRSRYQEVFRKADLVLCEGPYMAGTLRALGCPEHRLAIHELGVPVARIPCRPRVVPKDGPVRFLIASGFREKKGIPDALRALRAASSRFPGLEVTVIGDAGPDGQAEKRSILTEAGRMGPSTVVRLLGLQPHEALLDEAQRHHVFVAASRTAADGDAEGGAPVVLLEMAATGMPVLSTTHCDIPYVVRHGETGLLSRERDIEGLAANAEALMAHPDLITRMGLAGRKFVEQRFNAGDRGSAMQERYVGLLRAGPAAQGFRQGMQ